MIKPNYIIILLYLIGKPSMSCCQNEMLSSDTIYYDSGKMKSYGYLLNSKKIGYWVYENVSDSNEKWLYIYYGVNKVKTYSFKEVVSLKKVGSFINDDSLLHPDGLQISFKKGVPISIYNYQNGKPQGLCIDYYVDKKVIASYQNGEIEGYNIEYSGNGKIKILMSYNNGLIQGGYAEYYQNGFLKKKGLYEQGNKSGKWYEYYGNGNLKSCGNYEIFEATEHNRQLYGITTWSGNYFSVKVGSWSFWDENGKLVKKEIYKYGRIVETVKQ